MKKTTLSGAVVALLATAGSLRANIPVGQNLLTNGSATDVITNGWTVITAGGNGWTVGGGSYDGEGRSFITSYALCQRSQTIDLIAKGMTAADLDMGAPIRVSEAISMDNNRSIADSYYIKVELRDANGLALAKWEVGSATALKTAVPVWTLESFVFRNYGPGVRSIYFEDGGVDGGFWAGFYGTYHDAAKVEFIDAPPTDITLTPSTVGEGTPAGGIVGNLSAVDQDDLIHTFALVPESTAANVPLITAGATGWRYLDGTVAPPSDWASPTFNDSAWSTGAAPLGYDSSNADAWLVTHVGYGADTNNKPATSYYRKTFDVADPAAVTALLCTLQVDDGCVAYLNGHEIFRDGMPAGVITGTTLSNRTVSGTDESDFTPVAITADKLQYLQAGTNVLAVEVHQQNVTSSDITLDLNLSATTKAVTNSYSNDLFEISGADLLLKNDGSTIFPGDYVIRVQATDHENVSFTKLITVQRTNAGYGATPADLSLSSLSVAENVPAGSLLGTLTVADLDIGQGHRFQLVAGEGDADNSQVLVWGDKLLVKESPDYEKRHELRIRLQVTDSTGFSFTKPLVIQIINDTAEDQDGDGLTEAEEDLNGNGILDPGETDPLLADTDGDGYTDRVELQAGSDPRNPASIPAVLELRQIKSHITGDSWLTAASWENGQTPDSRTLAITDNATATEALTFRPPPVADPVFPGVGLDLRNGALLRLKHTGLLSIGRIILRNATIQQGMTSSVALGGGGAKLEIPDIEGVTPDGIIDSPSVPLDLRASLSGSGTLKFTGAAGTVRLLSPAASFSGELVLENPEVIVVDPAAITGTRLIGVTAGSLRFEADTTLGFTELNVSGTGKLNLTRKLTVAKAAIGGIAIPNGTYTVANLTSTVGVPAASLVDGGGTLVVGASVNPNLDSDGDGIPDVLEVLAHTDPYNAADFLRLSGATIITGNNLRLEWAAVPGVTYTLQRSSDPTSGWQDVTTVSPTTVAGVYDLSLTSPLPAKLFFRLAVKN